MAVIEERLSELGIELPAAPAPVASYLPVRLAGGLAFVAGQIPLDEGALRYPGKVGAEVSIEQGVDGARRCALQALAALRNELGSLDRVRGIVKVDVFVASAPGFVDQPQVANGASDTLVEIFGEAGRHARAAVGVAELPLGASVEVAIVAAID
ncbi:MAG TPA: RidA family protein [Actinomycetota bacterium]|nr:RidA family protein [Actinomycetota bacterium]